jgi:hypothetical protein
MYKASYIHIRQFGMDYKTKLVQIETSELELAIEVSDFSDNN